MGAASTILIVEPDFTRALLVETAFARNGVNVRTVRSGEGAQCYIDGSEPYSDRTNHPAPALVVLDLDIGNAGGLTLVRWIRSESTLRDLPIIAYGNFETQQDMQGAFDSGANACFPRQYGIIKIISAVKELDWVNEIVARNKQ